MQAKIYSHRHSWLGAKAGETGDRRAVHDDVTDRGAHIVIGFEVPATRHTPRVAAIVFTHQSSAVLEGLLGSLPEGLSCTEWQLIVVDNASTDHTVTLGQAVYWTAVLLGQLAYAALRRPHGGRAMAALLRPSKVQFG